MPGLIIELPDLVSTKTEIYGVKRVSHLTHPLPSYFKSIAPYSSDLTVSRPRRLLGLATSLFAFALPILRHHRSLWLWSASMGDKSVKQTTARGAVSTADMAARPFKCKRHQVCSMARRLGSHHKPCAPLACEQESMLTGTFGCRVSSENPIFNVMIARILTNVPLPVILNPVTRLSYRRAL